MAAIDLSRFGRAKPLADRRSSLDAFVEKAYRDQRQPAADLVRVIKAYLDTQKKPPAA